MLKLNRKVVSMDIRTIEYYLAVAREGNISAAAEALHVSQPSLSRQMKDLETELGVILFERGNRRIELTEEGMVLRKHAEGILHLVHQTEKEITEVKNKISGDISIGAGESHAFHHIAEIAGRISAEYPGIRFHIVSGDTADLMDQLSCGLIDFALIFTDCDPAVYQSVTLPEEDIYGVLMRKDSPLAKKKSVRGEDLQGQKVLTARAGHPYLENRIDLSGVQLIGTYNLLYNASLLVEDGIGCALAFDRIIPTGAESDLCFRPLDPPITVRGMLIWKKYQIFSPAVQLFAEEVERIRNENPER